MYWSQQKQQLIDRLNINLEEQICLLRTDTDLSIGLCLLLEDYYTDMNYRMRKSLGGTEDWEDWIYERTKTTEALPAEVRP